MGDQTRFGHPISSQGLFKRILTFDARSNIIYCMSYPPKSIGILNYLPILYHIQEWRRQKRLIKAFIPLEFLLEWFLKLLFPYIAKDVSTSGVQNEEQVIFRVQELDLIYAQFGLLYEIIPNAPDSSSDPKVKPGPHADGIVGCTSTKPTDSVV